MDEQRGIIKNRNYATQIKDFSGLRYGKITPTDIDGFIDFGNKLFIFMETKFKESLLPYGQRLALERLVDNGTVAYSLGIISEHETNGDIDMANCIVREIRWKKVWYIPKTAKSVKETIDSVLELYLPNYLLGEISETLSDTELDRIAKLL